MATSKQNASQPPTHTPSTIPVPVAGLLIFVLAVGVYLALHLVDIKLRLEFDPTYVSSCNVDEKINCDKVQTSAYSSVFGQPLALWGVATYAFLILLTGAGATMPLIGRSALAITLLVGAGSVVHAAYLFYVSKVLIGAICLYCMGMYGVNLGFTAAAFWGWKKLGGNLGGVVPTALRPIGVGVAVALLALSLGVALPGYTSVRDGRKAERIALEKAKMAKMLGGTGAPAKGSAGSGKDGHNEDMGKDGRGGPSTAETQEPVAAQAPVNDDIVRNPGQPAFSKTVTNKGRAYFEVPVTEHDPVLGNKDAPVTVVEFADFQCGYCKALHRNLKKVKDKYAPTGKVRFVFKHWPLNNSCNPIMKGTQHKDACKAVAAADCLLQQSNELFWAYHDELFENGHQLNDATLTEAAKKVGLKDVAKWDACRKEIEADFALPDVERKRGGFANHDKKLGEDIRAGRFARIAGTPRMYVQGHLVPGVVASEVLDYYLSEAIKRAENGESTTAPAAAAKAESKHGMVQIAAKTEGGKAYWIDAYEASLDGEGRALSKQGVQPAEVSWFEAKKACEGAGKRMCTEAEWIGACSGELAVDDNKDGDPTNDEVEGNLYPYGAFYLAGTCNDDGDKKSRAVPTGTLTGCKTPTGIYDMAGNLAEWTGATEDKGILSGADFRWGAKADCLNRQDRFGLGYRNTTTGFRCCADEAVAPKSDAAIKAVVEAAEGDPAPGFSVEMADGKKVTEKDLKGRVTIVSFFASWCGPCRRELPQLDTFYREHKAKGLRVLAIGVDTDRKVAQTFAESLKLAYDVAYDEDAVSHGAFGVRGMPTTFLIDRDGIIRKRLVGINAGKVEDFQKLALDLLAKK